MFGRSRGSVSSRLGQADQGVGKRVKEAKDETQRMFEALGVDCEVILQRFDRE